MSLHHSSLPALATSNHQLATRLVEAHSYRVIARAHLGQICSLYARAEALDPTKTQARIEEALKTLSQYVPELKDLLRRQNAQMDALTASNKTTAAERDAAIMQRNTLQAIVDAAAAKTQADAEALAEIDQLVAANPAPTGGPVEPTAVQHPDMTTFTQA